ncbi:transposase [Rickettsiella endosymbiont of Dermanyssus gallinae]|uniref:transposase n=1 Tax=Rickettsiella endosymbiont of Dermanyssus gallinae TaxID=2856608 RepID=UPI003CCE7D52
MEIFVINTLKRTIEISCRITKKWSLLPKRWVIERTFSWLNHFRRLSKDYEITTSSAENYVMISHSIGLLRRLFKP